MKVQLYASALDKGVAINTGHFAGQKRYTYAQENVSTKGKEWQTNYFIFHCHVEKYLIFHITQGNSFPYYTRKSHTLMINQ
jgi:hypothetical protein